MKSIIELLNEEGLPTIKAMFGLSVTVLSQVIMKTAESPFDAIIKLLMAIGGLILLYVGIYHKILLIRRTKQEINNHEKSTENPSQKL